MSLMLQGATDYVWFKAEAKQTFVEQEVAFLHNVFVESIFCFPSDSVINFSPIHRVRKNLFLVLQ